MKGANKKVIFKLLGFLLVPFVLFLIADNIFPLKTPDKKYLFAQVVTDQAENPLYAFADSEGVWRYPVEMQNVSPYYIEALINYEDRWFWYHPGINPVSLIRALMVNTKSGHTVSGGSTLTMQVARQLHPHTKTVLGKFHQIFRAIQLEFHFSKRDILNLYLSLAPFGGTIEGVQAASFTYLNKPASQLTHAEAALLCVLPQSPSRLRPDRHSQKAEEARNKVLDRMHKIGVWSESVVRDAKQESVYSYRIAMPNRAPHLAHLLSLRYPDNEVIKTHIQGDLQRSLEDYLENYIRRFPDATSSAVMIVENDNANVIAYVGSANFYDDGRYGQVDMIQAIRSPGSTLKPFLYGLAVDNGLIHTHSLLSDAPRIYGEYRPSNFSEKFSGPVSVTEALQRSLNVPAVELLEHYGSKRFAANIENAGIAFKIPGGQPNLAMILGGVGVSLETLVMSYRAISSDGSTIPLNYVQGETLSDKRFFLSPGSAWIVRQILRGSYHEDRLHTLSQRKTVSSLAFKTGTSYGFRDAWAIGMTQKYTIGVWVGRPDGTPSPGQFGTNTAAPLLMTIAGFLPDANMLSDAKPDSVREEIICWPLGTAEKMQSPEFCHQRYSAYVLNQQIPPTWSQSEDKDLQINPYTFWINPKTGRRVDMACNAEKKQSRTVALWPKILEPWIAASYRRASLIPRADNSCKTPPAINVGNIHIAGIQTGAMYKPAGNSDIRPKIYLKSIGGFGKRYWYFNGAYRYSSNSDQTIVHTLSEKGEVQISVVDEQGNTDMVVIKSL